MAIAGGVATQQAAMIMNWMEYVQASPSLRDQAIPRIWGRWRWRQRRERE
jgi:hypothetical protein